MSAERPMATCTSDGEPLVFTFEFRGAEFYCVVCHRVFGYFGPEPAVRTPELDARLEELRTQYNTERAERSVQSDA